MDTIIRMFEAHPSGHAETPIPDLVTALKNCESTTTICADACLTEPDVDTLVDCIALNMLCADVCATTARLASRVGHHHKSIMLHQLQACREACRLCAEECERHEHEHCRVCAEACRGGMAACDQVLERAVAMA